MNSELNSAISRVSKRLRGRQIWTALAICWLGWAIIGFSVKWWLVRNELLPSSVYWLVGTIGFLTIASALTCVTWIYLRSRSVYAIAKEIEAKHPDLNTALLAAVDAEASSPTNRYGYLNTALMGSVLTHRRTHDWNETISTRSILTAKILHAITLAGLLLVAFLLVAETQKERLQKSSLATKDSPFEIRVSPGDAEVERGSPFLVVAEFGAVVPAEANIIFGSAAQDEEQSRSARMTRSLQDPMFATRLEQVDADFAYHITFDGQRSEDFHVTVFEYPEVRRADAQLSFPSYSSLPPRVIEDVRHVTAVEGSDLTLSFHINKEISKGQLVDEQGDPLKLVRVPMSDNVYSASLKLAETRRFKVELTDQQGRHSKVPFEFTVNVTPNRPPVVKNVQPSKDTRVSPVEELSLSGVFEDDFGVIRHGLSYTLAGKEPVELELASPAGPSQKLEAGHLLDFESLNAEADELVTYFLWAEDIGPDGEPRRTASDMYFAEVRPFEEIFRQGEQPQGGESQRQQQQQGGENGQEAMQLAELQKQIINATWNLIRREQSPTPSERFSKDVKLLAESQQSAIQMAEGLGERLRDATSRSRLQEAVGFMGEAADLLESGADRGKIESLKPALAVEQAAYQSLLKLRDREFDVSRSNSQQQGGSSGAAGSPSQRQLQQLELTNDPDRYEQQRSAQSDAQSQQQRQQQELRQVLNRLRELAQRQNDLNERIKELQSALEAAAEREKREELERQLKRLREQQREILRDTDELQERMERESNRDRMQEALDQTRETRENVRRASEALEEGQLSEALTEGTRAGEQLKELQESVRKQTANQFEQSVTDLKNEARRLDETQEELSQKLAASADAREQTLRGGPDREQLEEQLRSQRERLETLTDQMRQLVQDAEETEPQLAEAVFEAIREAETQSLPEALQAAERLSELGIPEEAARASQSAARGLRQLREDIDRAAESIIGDETAALQLAEAELNELSEQLDQEFEQSRATDGERRQQPIETFGENALDQERPERGEDRGDLSSEQTSDNTSGQTETPSRDAEQRSGASPASGAATRLQSESGEPNGRRPSSNDRQSGQAQSPEAGDPNPEGDAGNSNRPEEPQPTSGESGRNRPSPSEGSGSSAESRNSSGQPGEGGSRSGSQRGEPSGLRAGGAGGRGPSPNEGGQQSLDTLIDALGSEGSTTPSLPITGEGFVQWSDRMRSVEELLEDPALRAEAARIRDRVRGAREDFKRHSKEPDWAQLQTLVAEPLAELKDRVAEEVRRRRSPDSLVPIDRDPVPPEFVEGVRRYYERLGSGQ